MDGRIINPDDLQMQYEPIIKGAIQACSPLIVLEMLNSEEIGATEIAKCDNYFVVAAAGENRACVVDLSGDEQ